MITTRPASDRGHTRLDWLDTGETAEHRLADDRRAWVQVARGTVNVNGQALAEGDGAFIEKADVVRIQGQGGAEVLLFDLP